jgi:hypothetical protein
MSAGRDDSYHAKATGTTGGAPSRAIRRRYPCNEAGQPDAACPCSSPNGRPRRLRGAVLRTR